jgi:hypothetical protein
MKRYLAYAHIPVTPAFWSANYYVAAKAVGEIEPHALAFMRTGESAYMSPMFKAEVLRPP